MGTERAHRNPFPDDVEVRVIEYATGKFAPVVSRGGEWEFTGGRVYGSLEAAETAIPDGLALLKRFWADQLARRANAVVIGGAHHRIGTQRPGRPGHVYGFGGRTFYLRSLTTGQVTECSDLWWQGVIPDFARPAFPDTHEFISTAEEAS